MAVRAILAVIVGFLSNSVIAQELVQNSNRSREDMVFLAVDKSNLRADLRTWPEDASKSEILMSFRIAVGKAEGDKQREGDNKTPEGIYFAQTIIPGKTLPAKYGSTAIPIDFPNPFDQSFGKTGYGIWLHGVERDKRIEAAKVTEGCVAFYNSDILTLTNWLRPSQAIIVISKNSEVSNKPTDVAVLKAMAQGWAMSWESRDHDSYISNYHGTFRYRGMNLKRFASYKKRVFKSYSNMKVDIFDLRVFTHEKYGLTVMNQDFDGDGRYVSKGRKILYWVKDENENWKILHEKFDSNRLKFMKFSDSDVAQNFRNSPSLKVFGKSYPQNL